MSIKVKIETKQFMEVVLPALREHDLLTGKVIPVEGIEVEALREMDFFGIDYLYVGCGLDGLSVRIQESKNNWASYTVRCWTEGVGSNTEYQKSIEAIENDCIRSKYFIQAYIWHDEVVACAICLKRDLIKYIQDNKSTKIQHTYNARFYVVYWDDFEKAGYPIWKI